MLEKISKISQSILTGNNKLYTKADLRSYLQKALRINHNGKANKRNKHRMVNKPVKIETFQTVGVFEKSKLTEKPIKNLSILSPRDILQLVKENPTLKLSRKHNQFFFPYS